MEDKKEIIELLEKMEKSNRQQALIGLLQCIFSLAAVVCCVIAVMMVRNVLPELEQTMVQIDAVLNNLEQVTGQLAELDFANMVKDVDALVATGQDSLEQTMEKLNSIDFDVLNRAIQNLSNAVEPVARFFKVFK